MKHKILLCLGGGCRVWKEKDNRKVQARRRGWGEYAVVAYLEQLFNQGIRFIHWVLETCPESSDALERRLQQTPKHTYQKKKKMYRL